MNKYRLDAIERQSIAKAQTKAFHDNKISTKEFKVNDYVLLYSMRLHKHPAKLESLWEGPFKVLQVSPNGSLLLQSGGNPFRVNGHRCKKYFTWSDDSKHVQYIGSVNVPEFMKYECEDYEVRDVLSIEHIEITTTATLPEEEGFTIV